ncbi:serine/threonine protein kinase US3 [Ateline alphaherpesvirus 1]|uniref:non-specific serine/threonine protein kinase n=1 Tax=Herpesvirus ateles type 1 (strain Lennette) TaxID=35243 RepID=A0A1S6JLS5_HSVA1|nr:serine/threonine protein kinase US3 [Ateline alphaherpesvirus 1]AQS79220.1 serine/threonine protein kinase US3 [Ateline alphaherpesvirus 1]
MAAARQLFDCSRGSATEGGPDAPLRPPVPPARARWGAPARTSDGWDDAVYCNLRYSESPGTPPGTPPRLPRTASEILDVFSDEDEDESPGGDGGDDGARAPGASGSRAGRGGRPTPAALADLVASLGFRVRETLTPGSEGRVFVGTHPDYTQTVVVKAGWYPSTALEGAFLRELDHPNIPALLDAHTANGITCLVLPHFRTDLYGFLYGRRHPPALRTIVSFARQLLDALRYVHLRNIIHRDVKTENIFVDEHHTLYLGDFGAACRTWHPHHQARRYGLVGTVDINAPEMLAGDAYTSSVDIWGAGLVVFDVAVADASLFSSCGDGADRGPSPERQIARIIRQAQVHPDEFPADPEARLNQRYRAQASRLSRAAYTRPAWTRQYSIHADVEYLICRMLTFDGARRPSAEELLRLPLFGGGGPVLGHEDGAGTAD